MAAASFAALLLIGHTLFRSGTDPSTAERWIPFIPALMCCGSLLSAVGYFSKLHHYGSAIGAVTGGSLVPATLMFMDFLLSSSQIRLTYYWDVFGWGAAMFFFFGVCAILMGVSHIVSRFHMGHPHLGGTAGIFFILSGAFFLSYFLFPIGIALLFGASICGALNLMLARYYEYWPGGALEPPYYPNYPRWPSPVKKVR